MDVEKTLEIFRQLCRENDEEQEEEKLLRVVDILHERDSCDLLIRGPNLTANDLHNASLSIFGISNNLGAIPKKKFHGLSTIL